jgi:hypothetical protein
MEPSNVSCPMSDETSTVRSFCFFRLFCLGLNHRRTNTGVRVVQTNATAERSAYHGMAWRDDRVRPTGGTQPSEDFYSTAPRIHLPRTGGKGKEEKRRHDHYYYYHHCHHHHYYHHQISFLACIASRCPCRGPCPCLFLPPVPCSVRTLGRRALGATSFPHWVTQMLTGGQGQWRMRETKNKN